MWEPQLSLAEGGWRIIAPQLRGMDGAESDPPAESMDDYAADIVDLLEALGIEDAVVAGLSLGGYVTFALFRRAPRFFRAMVLADTRPQADTLEGREGRKRMLALLEAGGPSAVADEMLPKLLGETTRQQQPEVAERVRALIQSSSRQAIAGMITALMTRADSTPLLRTIHCPTLIVVGDEDVITPPALSRDMQQAIARSELVLLPGVGHLANLEQPATFNSAIARFLERF
jgi:pimeloyl-ACP methyl ester carboxylesterase